MKIGIDIDEVLGHFLPALTEFHNCTYGTNLKVEQFHSYNFWEICGGTKEEMLKKIDDFELTPYFKNIQAVAGAKDSVKALKEKHELFIITSRPISLMQETKIWLDKNFPNTFSNIFFANNEPRGQKTKSKGEYCNELGLEIMIEDSAIFDNECTSPDRKVFLINQPWNKNSEVSPDIIRVNSWDEIMKQI